MRESAFERWRFLIERTKSAWAGERGASTPLRRALLRLETLETRSLLSATTTYMAEPSSPDYYDTQPADGGAASEEPAPPAGEDSGWTRCGTVEDPMVVEEGETGEYKGEPEVVADESSTEWSEAETYPAPDDGTGTGEENPDTVMTCWLMVEDGSGEAVEGDGSGEVPPEEPVYWEDPDSTTPPPEDTEPIDEAPPEGGEIPYGPDDPEGLYYICYFTMAPTGSESEVEYLAPAASQRNVLSTAQAAVAQTPAVVEVSPSSPAPVFVQTTSDTSTSSLAIALGSHGKSASTPAEDTSKGPEADLTHTIPDALSQSTLSVGSKADQDSDSKDKFKKDAEDESQGDESDEALDTTLELAI